MGKGLILALLLVSACTTTQAPRVVSDPKAVWCSQNEARRPTRSVFEAMDRIALNKMNTHNQKGTKWCGWKP